MHALYFPGLNREQIRDIVRLITSATSSAASLSGLEFIDTNQLLLQEEIWMESTL